MTVIGSMESDYLERPVPIDELHAVEDYNDRSKYRLLPGGVTAIEVPERCRLEEAVGARDGIGETDYRQVLNLLPTWRIDTKETCQPRPIIVCEVCKRRVFQHRIPAALGTSPGHEIVLDDRTFRGEVYQAWSIIVAVKGPLGHEPGYVLQPVVIVEEQDGRTNKDTIRVDAFRGPVAIQGLEEGLKVVCRVWTQVTVKVHPVDLIVLRTKAAEGQIRPPVAKPDGVPNDESKETTA